MRRRDVLAGALALSVAPALRLALPLAAAGCAGSSPPVRPAVATGGRSLRPRVAIVGGGLAGLAAALALAGRGVSVTVLEAQDRPGGRIQTVRSPLTEGLHVEAGAKHVVGDPDLLALIGSVGIETAPRPRRKGAPLAQITHVGGVRRVYPVGEEPPDADPLTPEEEALSFSDRLERYLPAIVGFDPLRDRHVDAEARRLDALRADDYLRAQGASPGLVRGMDGAFGVGPGLASMSALSLVRDVANLRREIGLGGGGGGRIPGGTDRLPLALAERLGADLLLGADVKSVETTGAGVRVTFERRGARASIEADRVLLAVPSTVVSRIDLARSLSAAKRSAIAEIGATSVTRLWIETSERPWLGRGESATADTDLAIGRIQDEIDGLEGPRGVLAAYLSGSKARRLGELADAPRIAAASDDLERVHPGTKASFVAGASKVWDDDPFARGGYAWFAPGQLTEGGGARWAPEGRVHFAGCHTSHRPGFMHGALASARRAVREMVAELEVAAGQPPRSEESAR